MSEPMVIALRRPEQPGALYLEFHNPDSMNSFTMEMWRQLIAHLRAAKNDSSIRCVVIRGAGDRAFSSGLSMDMLDNVKDVEDYAEIHTKGMEVRESIFSMNKPVIAAVKGYCVGGGLEISLCCDLIYAAEGSKFKLPEINIGLVPGCGGAIHLPEKIPVNRAFEMLLFSESMSAEEAKSWGLVNKIFPLDSFDKELYKIVDKIISKPPLAVAGLKELMGHSVTQNEMASLAVERRLSLELMGTEDFKEAVSAFREKRIAVFKGK